MSDISQLFFEMEYRTAQAKVGAVLLANSFTAKGATKPRSRLFRTFINRTPVPFCHFRFRVERWNRVLLRPKSPWCSFAKYCAKLWKKMENNITWITILQLLFASFHSDGIKIRSRNILASCHFEVRTTQQAFFWVKNRQKQWKNRIKYITILQLLFTSFHSDFIEIRSKNIFPRCHFEVRNTQHAFL